MSNSIDPLKLFLNNNSKKTSVKPLSLNDIDNINKKMESKLSEVKEKEYAHPAQIEYFKRFEEKGLAQVNLFIKEDYRNRMRDTSAAIKLELEKRGKKNYKSNRHLIANIIFDFYFANNPDFEKSIHNAVFGTER